MRKKPVEERLSIIQEKERQLESLKKEASYAVNTVTLAMDNLCRVNDNMHEKINEIDSYVESLGAIRNELTVNLAKNEKIRSNFAALLCVEE